MRYSGAPNEETIRHRKDLVCSFSRQPLLVPGYYHTPKGKEINPHSLSTPRQSPYSMKGRNRFPWEIKPAILVNLQENMQLKLHFFLNDVSLSVLCSQMLEKPLKVDVPSFILHKSFANRGISPSRKGEKAYVAFSQLRPLA